MLGMVGRPHHPHCFVLTGHIWRENRYRNSRHCVQLRLRTRARLSAQASVLAHALQPALHLAQANLCQMACILARLQHVLQGLQCHDLAVWKLQPTQHMFQRMQALLMPLYTACSSRFFSVLPEIGAMESLVVLIVPISLLQADFAFQVAMELSYERQR